MPLALKTAATATRLLGVMLLLCWSPLRAQQAPPTAAPGEYGVRETWTSADKWYHLGISAAGAAALYSGGRVAGMRRWRAVAVAAGVMGAVGLYREIDDERRPDKYFSEKDLLWDAVGIAVGIVVPDFLFQRRRGTEVAAAIPLPLAPPPPLTEAAGAAEPPASR